MPNVSGGCWMAQYCAGLSVSNELDLIPGDSDEKVGMRLAEMFHVQDGSVLGDPGTAMGTGRQGGHFRRMPLWRFRPKVSPEMHLLSLKGKHNVPVSTRDL